MDQTNQFPPINNMPVSTPPSAQIPSTFPVTEKPKKVGPIIAVLVVILIIVIVALYLLASRVSSPVIDNIQANNALQTPIAEVVPQDVTPITNTNDDINSLQADLDASISGIETQSI